MTTQVTLEPGRCGGNGEFMKKFLAIVLIAVMVMTVMACRNTASEPTAVEEDTVVEAAGEVMSTEEAAAVTTVEAEEETTAAENLVTYVTGEVTDAAMHSFVLILEDGSSMDFSIADETVTTLKNGLLEGEQVTVGFTGDAESDDLGDRMVLTIADHC